MAFHDRPTVPVALADAALIDGAAFAASLGVSLSKFHDLVRTGRAPAPVVRQHRFTRWRLADARAFLEQVARDGMQSDTGDQVVQRATIASAAAKRSRAAGYTRIEPAGGAK